MRYLCIVSYDGYSFSGYQIQKHDKNTIQENIQNALEIVFNEMITIFASGRTDKGVHAIKQYFHFDSDKIIPLNNLKKALNNNLVDAIRIKKVMKVNEDFHARFSTHQKIYEYHIINSANEDVFKNRYNTYIKDKIDIELLNKASKLFLGKHDFYSFTTNKKEEVENFEKTIYDIKVINNKNNIKIVFYGSGFLRYQVRMMVGALIAVSTLKKDISYIENLLNNMEDNKCSYKASPSGLYLRDVIY